jgi:hypothetical protein
MSLASRWLMARAAPGAKWRIALLVLLAVAVVLLIGMVSGGEVSTQASAELP